MRLKQFVMAIGLLALSASSYAGAVKNKPSSQVWDQLTPAWDAVSQRLIGFVGEKKQQLLADLAFAAAAAEQCDGLALNQEKFKSAFDGLNDAAYQALAPSDQAQYGPKLMNYFGIYVGLLTAEAVLEQASFCTYASNQHLIGAGKYWLDTNTGNTNN